MLNNGNKTNCEFTNEIVAYIYDEIIASERVKFEKHLTVCHECTNGFAGISNARLSMFEWRRDEFADLPTPEIVIPYPAKRKADDEVSTGVFAGVRGWLSFANFPVAAAAGLVVFLGVGLLLMSYLSRGDGLVAANFDVPKVETTDKPVVQPKTEPKQPETTAFAETPLMVRPRREVGAVKVVENQRLKTKSPITTRHEPNRNVTANVPDAPTLSENFEEDGDMTLRLADLFEDDES